MMNMNMTLSEKREALKALRASIKEDLIHRKAVRANAKRIKLAARAEKDAMRAAKKAERIAKLEAKLAALKIAPVGTAARKAAKKPSKVTIMKMAA